MTRFYALAALRGIAATMVMLHHVGTMTRSPWLSPYGYLAVDLFFVLSGFVIGSAYERRLNNGLTFWKYMAGVRIVRMYPMILLGAVLGLLAAEFGAIQSSEPTASFLKQLALIPSVNDHNLFILNTVMWSLVLELIVNATHSAFLKYLSDWVVAFVTLAGSMLLIVAAYSFYSLDIGWNGSNILGGGPRVIFSFFCGLLIYRLHTLGRLPKSPISFPLCVIAVAVVMLVPLPSVRHHLPMVHDIFAVMIVFPLTIVAGTQTVLIGWRKAGAQALEGLSYPLYAIHFPLIHIAVLLLAIEPITQASTTAWWVGFCIAVPLVAWMIDVAIERPFVNWWRKHRLSPQDATLPHQS